MARFARVVLPGMPYHITHRGNHRGKVFFSDDDREVYLAMLAEGARRHGVEIRAWCLMTNHVHFVAVGREKLSFANGIGRTQMRYSRRINTGRGWTGHLWANRFHSSVLDGPHLLAALKYVEQNPVRGGLVAQCQEYPWSSAAYHAGLRLHYPLVSPDDAFSDLVDDWGQWVNTRLDSATETALRRNTSTGRPCGSPEFVRGLEVSLARDLSAPKRGRPRKAKPDTVAVDDLFK